MEQENLGDLYDEAILQENRLPYHFGKQTGADVTLEAYNPLCGDQYKIFLFLEEGRIKKAYFHGYGCAVSKASTSVLARELEGLSPDEARLRCKDFLSWLEQGDRQADPVKAGWQAFATVRKFPGRLHCAQLAWKTVADEI